MARTTKSRGKSGFKMRSTNKTSFKDMGSSPVKFTNPTTGDDLNPYAPDVIQTMGAMGVSDDVMMKILKQKAGEEIEAKEIKIDKGEKIDTEAEINKNVSEIEEVKKVKPKKTKFQEKWEKKHGTGDYKRGGSKERERMQKGESEFQYKNRIKKMNKGLKDLRGTPDKDLVDLTRKTDGAPVAGGSGSKTSYTPPETSELSFSDVNDNKKSVMGQSAIGTFENDPENPMFGATYRYSDIPVVTDEFNNPIYKKSPYKKGLGKYAKKAKGSRGYKMKRK